MSPKLGFGFLLAPSWRRRRRASLADVFGRTRGRSIHGSCLDYCKLPLQESCRFVMLEEFMRPFGAAKAAALRKCILNFIVCVDSQSLTLKI
jgi:hypothetical protein